MYEEHPVFEKPSDENIAIWRYLDFTKFVLLLDRSALFFARSDTLGDPFEGSYPRPNIASRSEMYSHLPKKSHPNWSSRMEDLHRRTRTLMFINSWHMSDCESAAMWKLYLKSQEGVAIRSRFSRLTGSLQHYVDEDVLIGVIRYVDYETEKIPEENVFWAYLHKRKSFEFEHELRAVILPSRELVSESGEAGVRGLYVPVDLEVLIDKVFVSPTAPAWFTELVASTMNKLGVTKDVVQSSLACDPLY